MSEIDLQALAAEFPRASVSWRAQTVSKDGSKALALCYIDARDVMERLDAVVGPANWSDAYDVHQNVTICTIAIRIGDSWVTKADGAGDTDVEAEKGRISDAFKRAAVKWSVGRYLYATPSPWVPCESYDTGQKDKFGNIKWGWRKWTDDPWNYVRQPPKAEPRVAVNPVVGNIGGGIMPTDGGGPASPGVAKPLTPAQSNSLMMRLSEGLNNQPSTSAAIDAWLAGQRVVDAIAQLLPEHKASLDVEINAARKYADKPLVPPDFSGIEQGKDGYGK